MPFDISTFRFQLDSHNGIQRPSLFQVTLTLPTTLLPIYVGTVQDITFLCIEGIIPGASVDSMPVFRYGYGPLEKMPFIPVFNDVTYLFIGDGAGFIKNFFRTWQRSIVEYCSEDNPSIPALASPNQTNLGMLPYFLNYKNDYSTVINISSWQVTGTQLSDTVNLRQAFPINVADLTYNWDNSNDYEIIPVTFSYRDVSYSSLLNPFYSALANVSIANTTGGVFQGAASSFSSQISATASRLESFV